MIDLDDLVYRCLSAERPDRSLDADLARATGWVQDCDTTKYSCIAPYWFKYGVCERDFLGITAGNDEATLPHFTGSLGTARKLVDLTGQKQHWSTLILQNGTVKVALDLDDFSYGVDAHVEACAVCAILLRYQCHLNVEAMLNRQNSLDLLE